MDETVVESEEAGTAPDEVVAISVEDTGVSLDAVSSSVEETVETSGEEDMPVEIAWDTSVEVVSISVEDGALEQTSVSAGEMAWR